MLLTVEAINQNAIDLARNATKAKIDTGIFSILQTIALSGIAALVDRESLPSLWRGQHRRALPVRGDRPEPLLALVEGPPRTSRVRSRSRRLAAQEAGATRRSMRSQMLKESSRHPP